jgi:hypothetical protein
LGAGTILLIAVAVLIMVIMVIMFRVADGVHGTAGAAPVAGRGVDTGGEPPLVGAKPEDVDGGAAAGHAAHGRRHGCW